MCRLLDISPTPWMVYMATPQDIVEMTTLASYSLIVEHDLNSVDLPYLAWNIDKAITNQRHNLASEQVLVARDKATNELRAWAWISRGGKMIWTQDEYCESRMLEIDQQLPLKQRMTLAAQIINYWLLWAKGCEIPYIINTTIRPEQRGFLRLHEKLGFKIRGSYAYKQLNKEQQ